MKKTKVLLLFAGILVAGTVMIAVMSCRSPQTIEQAFSRAKAGDVESQFDVGNLLLWQGDYTNAYHWLEAAAKTQNSGALQSLGIMYERGFAVSQDISKAFALYKQSANQGYPRAMKCLGTMYSMGWGCAKDQPEAVKWYRKAAERGDEAAFDCLGWAYLNGWGVAKDEAEGLRWLHKGADAGNPSSQANLSFAYIRGLGVQTNYAKAKAWAEKSAAQGYPMGLVNLGEIYRFGLGVQPDYVKARKYYEETIIRDKTNFARPASSSALAGAYVGLGDMLRRGQGEKSNPVAAIEMYRRGAELNDPEAECRLGASALLGVGVPRDNVVALSWYMKAAEHGSMSARKVLEDLRREGPTGPIGQEEFQKAKTMIEDERRLHQPSDPPR